MQKNISHSDELDTNAEKVLDRYESVEIRKITAILTGIFDEIIDLKNDML